MHPEPAGWAFVAIVLFSIVLLAAWILLPFAMFGVKSRLNHLVSEAKRTNSLLEDVRQQLKEQPK